MEKHFLPNRDFIFCKELTDLDNPVCIFYPEEEIIGLKLRCMIEFSKWFLKGTKFCIEFYNDDEFEDSLRWIKDTEPMDKHFSETVLREKLDFWLEECYTGDGFEFPETFGDKLTEFIEEKVGDYFAEVWPEDEQDELYDSCDFLIFRFEVAEYILSTIKEKTGAQVLAQTERVALAELEREEAERRYERELWKYHEGLVRKFQEEKLPWMLEKNYIDRPTWKKLNRAAELERALEGLDEPTKAAILHVGLPCLCSNSVRNDINSIVRKKVNS